MRIHSRCPKCSGTKLYVCANLRPDCGMIDTIHPFYVTVVPIPNERIGAEHGTDHRTHVGSYETWICAACGYTEWYAQDPEHLLEKLSKIEGSGIRVVETTPSAPYR